MSLEQEVSEQLRAVQKRLDAFKDMINSPMGVSSKTLKSPSKVAIKSPKSYHSSLIAQKYLKTTNYSDSNYDFDSDSESDYSPNKIKKSTNKKTVNPSFSISDDSSSYESDDSTYDNHHSKIKSLATNKNINKSRAPQVNLIGSTKNKQATNLYSMKKNQNQKWTNYMSDSSDFSDSSASSSFYGSMVQKTDRSKKASNQKMKNNQFLSYSSDSSESDYNSPPKKAAKVKFTTKKGKSQTLYDANEKYLSSSSYSSSIDDDYFATRKKVAKKYNIVMDISNMLPTTIWLVNTLM